MAQWAEIDETGNVVRTVVCDSDDGADGTLYPPAFLTDVLGGEWVRTYYDTPGKTFAGLGHKWNGSDFEAKETNVNAVEAVQAINMLEDREILLPEEANNARGRVPE